MCQVEGKSSQQRLKRPLRTKRNSDNFFSSHEHSQNQLKLHSSCAEGNTFRELSFEFKAGWSVWISMVKTIGRITWNCLVKGKKIKRDCRIQMKFLLHFHFPTPTHAGVFFLSQSQSFSPIFSWTTTGMTPQARQGQYTDVIQGWNKWGCFTEVLPYGCLAPHLRAGVWASWPWHIDTTSSSVSTHLGSLNHSVLTCQGIWDWKKKKKSLFSLSGWEYDIYKNHNLTYGVEEE